MRAEKYREKKNDGSPCVGFYFKPIREMGFPLREYIFKCLPRDKYRLSLILHGRILFGKVCSACSWSSDHNEK